MPRIPGYQADMQRQLNAPQQVEDPRQARFTADQFGDLGNSIQRFGGALAQQEQYEVARNREARNVELSNLGLELRGLSDDISNKAYMSSSPDGSDLVSKYDTEFDKYATDRLSKIKDPITQQQAYGEYLKVKVGQRDKLLGDSRRMFNDNAVKSYETRMNVGTSRVTSNPTAFDQEVTEYENTILNSSLTPEAKMNAVKLGRESMATAAIKGYINAGEYEEAKATLFTKFEGIYDQPKLEKLMEEIDTERAKSIDLAVKASDREEKVFKEALEERKNKNFLNIYKKVTDANALDPFDPGKGSSVEDLNSEIDNMVAGNELRFAEATHLKRFLNKDESKDSAEVSLSFYSRLARGEKLDKLRDDVLKASASKNLSAPSAQSLLQKIQTQKEKQSRRTGKGYSTSNPMFKESLKMIEANFKYDVTGGMQAGKLQENEAETKKIFYGLFYENPKYKADPMLAAREALKRTIPTYNINAQHFDEKEAAANPAAATKKLTKMYSEGALTKKQYYDQLLSLKNVQLRNQRDGK